MKFKRLHSFMKRRPRIYILPTRMGGYLNGLIFLMFLLSVGYNNNLLLIFTLFLFGFNLLWVIQGHYHLHYLKIDSINLEEGHAGEKVYIKFHWKKSPEGPLKWEFSLYDESSSYPIRSIDDSQTSSVGDIVFPKRGVLNFKHLRVKTEMPFGLYKVWIYLPVSLKTYVYPSKLPDAAPPLLHVSREDGEMSLPKKGPQDIWNLAPYQGEESRKISWKHYARTGDLLVKEGEEPAGSSVNFQIGGLIENKEFHLSQIATQMVICSNAQIAFSLQTPQRTLGLSRSSMHLQECLRELTTC